MIGYDLFLRGLRPDSSIVAETSSFVFVHANLTGRSRLNEAAGWTKHVMLITMINMRVENEIIACKLAE